MDDWLSSKYVSAWGNSEWSHIMMPDHKPYNVAMLKRLRNLCCFTDVAIKATCYALIVKDLRNTCVVVCFSSASTASAERLYCLTIFYPCLFLYFQYKRSPKANISSKCFMMNCYNSCCFTSYSIQEFQYICRWVALLSGVQKLFLSDTVHKEFTFFIVLEIFNLDLLICWFILSKTHV